MTVSVICEECGKIYHVPIAKLDQIKGDVVKAKCKNCGYIFHIHKEGKTLQETQKYDSLEETAAEESATDELDHEAFDDLEKIFQESAREATAAPVETAAPKKRGTGKKGKSGMGLRVKMLFLFMVIPLLLTSVSGFLIQRQMNVLTDDITAASADILKQMGEASIEATGKAVAAHLQKLEEQTEAVAVAFRNLNLITLVGTLVVIGLIVTLYGHNLVSRIRHLTDVADRISVGELDAEFNIKSKDEIGSLAEAIKRMQDSLSLSIERLRKKR